MRQLLDKVCSQVIEHARHALGPGSLCNEQAHARRVANLQVFTRQSHAKRELAILGQACIKQEEDA